ncbi:hypothetical protein MN202_09365 [Rheinheimera muenzenbergensis]|uniref:Bacteriocin-type signal sequence-containing protein n=1 Tax=Rheinheimera muenzenbergensis TaxID=1193628 RepID=A0ABU8C689_9GAMM
MQELTFEQVEVVSGGEGQSTSDAVRENAKTAGDTCGAGNVKSVTKDGFVCKD